ncbi:hypothetical protein J437_LFUL015515 [Ladona fulva]|uniref:C2 domain-containing protein n=1 Tax=Ladona fulva TaxID=123851 RepID=A0A8K0KH66_LADFU|nr:hypothetical protein J437_LFUL015515 [Ladona fulva]
MAHIECQGLTRSLPPGIIGNLSGYLSVVIGDVSFHRKDVRNVKIYISWWGEKDYYCMRYCPYKSYFPIFDGQHQTIGELCVEFHVVFNGSKPERFENLSTNKISHDDKTCVSNSATPYQDSRKFISQFENKKELQNVARDRLPPSKVDSGKCSLRNASEKDIVRDSGFRNISVASSVMSSHDVEEGDDCQEYIMDYILGKRMSGTEEKKAINCLKDWPALESVLEVLEGSSEFIRKSNPTKNIENTTGETYFIEYRFPSSNPKESEIRPWKEPPRGVRMSSKRQVGSVIFFNQSSIHCLSKNHQLLNEQLGTTLEFRILSRNLNQRVPSLIGEAQILLGDLLPEDEHASNLQKLPIFTNQSHNRKTKGMLVLRIKWVHIAKGLENDPEDESDKKTKQSDPDEVSPSSLQHINTPIPEACLTPGVVDPTEREVPLLHIILNVSEAYYCLTSMDPFNVCRRTNFNIYLVFRAFWNKEIPSRTHIVWGTNNPKFEFSLMVPLKITPNFINMCQENYMVIELWHKPSELGKDVLLGIAKVPIHQFYTSYKVPTLFPEVIKLKHPVVSMNGNVKVYNPIDPSKICGWVNVLLALGSQDQLYSVRQSNFVCSHPNDKMKENMRTNESLHVPEVDSINTSFKHQSLKLNSVPIEKYLEILKITEFEQFSKTPSLKNSDCYIEYRLPNDQHVLKTSLKPFSSEIEFFSSPIIIKFLENTSEEIIFRIWCRCYDTNNLPRDRMIATAKLSLRRLFLADNGSHDKTWEQKFSFPLLSVDSNDYSICSSLGFLEVKFSDRKQPTVESFETEPVKSSNREVISYYHKVPKQQNQESQTDIPFHNPHEQGPSLNNTTEVKKKKRKERYSTEPESLSESQALVNNERCDDIPTQNIQQETTTASSTQVQCPRHSDTSAMPVATKDNFCPILSCPSAISDRVVSEKITKIMRNKTKSKATELFKVHIEIEKAIHLKCNAPISGAYVTFWSFNKIQLWITPNVQLGDHPKWNWHCDTHLNGDLLIKSSEKLILQIWTTKGTNTEPNPSVDLNLGSAAVDLRILIYGMPQVSGWFNILDLDNKCCGQIKITVTPVEDLSKFRQIAVKQWLSDYWKNDRQLIPSDLSAGRIDLYMEEERNKKMETEEKESREEFSCNLSEDEVKIAPLSNATHLALKSKIAELDEAMKQWRENLAVKEVDDFSNLATAEVQEANMQDTHPPSPVSSQGSSPSMSSNISRKLSRVNPSTELKNLEKYVSDLVQSIQNNASPSCISPILEELFYHYEYGGFAVPDKEVIEKESDILSSVHFKPNHSGKGDFFCLQSTEEIATKDMTESLRITNEALIDPHNNKSNNLVEFNEYSSDFHSVSEDGSIGQNVEKLGTPKIKEVDDFQDNISIQTEVIDLPRQAPEGGNPVEDEIVLGNRTSSQMILKSSSDMKNTDDSVEDDGALPVLDALDVNQELERIGKIFNTTFTKE